MFGRHKKKADGGDEHVSVDATLEGDIAQVEQSVAAICATPPTQPELARSLRWKGSMRRRTRATPTESR